jgi:hypothetical protein
MQHGGEAKIGAELERLLREPGERSLMDLVAEHRRRTLLRRATKVVVQNRKIVVVLVPWSRATRMVIRASCLAHRT